MTVTTNNATLVGPISTIRPKGRRVRKHPPSAWSDPSMSELVDGGNQSDDAPRYTDREVLHELYIERGLTQQDIGDRLGCSGTTVGNYLNLYGIEREEGCHKDPDVLRELYVEQGLGVGAIGERFGYCGGTIRYHLDEHGIERERDTRYKDPDILHELYIEEGMTCEAIGERLGCSPTTVHTYLHENDIERERDTRYKDPEFLHEMYIERGMSKTEIADVLDCSVSVISEYCREFGIRRDWHDPEWLREEYHEKGRSLIEMADEFGVHHSAIRRQMEKHDIDRRSMSEAQTSGDILKLHDRDWLHAEYIDHERTTLDIADELGVRSWAVSKWLDRHGIESRADVTVPGEENPNHKGGWQKYYGPSWHPNRRDALKRDDYKCQICGMGKVAHMELHDEVPHVHHIIPFRKFGIENHESANDLSNLVVLCREHHRQWEGIPLRPLAG